jgi:transposase
MNKLYYTAQEVAEMLGVSRGQAYKIVKQLNAELAEMGKIVVSGKVPKRLFSERYYGGVDAEDTER